MVEVHGRLRATKGAGTSELERLGGYGGSTDAIQAAKGTLKRGGWVGAMVRGEGGSRDYANWRWRQHQVGSVEEEGREEWTASGRDQEEK